MTASFQRVLTLEGGCNFRDLGGYPTNDGRKIRTGVLFRSGVMSHFTPNDHPHLTRLELRTICDLRRADERESEPTRWPVEVRSLFWDIEPTIEAAQQGAPWENAADAAHARTIMIEVYRAMPAWLRPQLQGLFKCLIDGEVPLVFHCAAGKDRTGLSASVVLHTLGVPKETIFEDYELTNRAVDLHTFMRKHSRARLGLTDDRHPLDVMDPGVRQALFAADREYLSAAFEQIEKDHQSLDHFVRDVLGVGDSEKEQLRDALLTA